MPLTTRSFRLKYSLLAIEDDGENRTLRDLPEGTVVQAAATFDGRELVEVQWQGHELMMFAQDLQERAELVDKVAQG